MKLPSSTPCAKRRNARAIREGVIPKRLTLAIAEAKLESDAAEHQRKQHHEDREIGSRNDDGEGEREGCQQAEPTEHEPRLVPITVCGRFATSSPLASITAAARQSEAHRRR